MRDTVAKRRPMIDLEQFERRLRQPDAGSRTDEDALTELARVVGGPNDPYRAVFEAKEPRAAEVDQAQSGFEADIWDDPRNSETEPNMGRSEYGSAQTGASLREGPADLHENVDLNAFTADDQAEHWRYEDEALDLPNPDYEAETRSRRPLYVMAAIIVAGIFGIGASFALKGGSAPREIAMIKAVDGPAKVQPDNTAGAEIPNRDASILDRTPQAAPVAVADATEQPVDLARANAPEQPVATPATAVSGAASVAVPPSPARGLASPSQNAAQPQTIAGLIEPKKVKTVSVRPDGTVLSDDPAAQNPPAVAQLPVHIATTPGAKAATSKSTARIAAAAKPVSAGRAADIGPAGDLNAKAVQMADAQTGSVAAAASAPSTGAFAVQLAAPSSEKEARDIQLRLIKKYDGNIPGFHPSIRKAVSDGKTVYRVRTVGLSKENATALCQKVQSSGGNCFVAKN